jgi:hypothetical protein
LAGNGDYGQRLKAFTIPLVVPGSLLLRVLKGVKNIQVLLPIGDEPTTALSQTWNCDGYLRRFDIKTETPPERPLHFILRFLKPFVANPFFGWWSASLFMNDDRFTQLMENSLHQMICLSVQRHFNGR